MIDRYSTEDMKNIWSDHNRFKTWLKVELAVAEAMVEKNIVPKESYDIIKAKAKFSVERILEIEKTTRHDVIAFLTNLEENIKDPASRFIHMGMTSSDLLDTSLAIQCLEAGNIILEKLNKFQQVLRDNAIKYKKTYQIGRSHGVHAEPITFGLKNALWSEEVGRNIVRWKRSLKNIAVGKISGAVGTYAHLDPSIEEQVCKTLGLQSATIASQVIQRDRHADLLSRLAILAASLEKFAVEIRGLQKTEIGEVEEPFGKGQKGSSAMPHKRNPIGCEQLTGLARLVRANAMAAFENVALWHERDISHSSVERVILPDSFIAVDHMLRRFTRIVSGLVVHVDRMRENLALSRGVVFSGTVLLELARRGVSREQAYEWVQRNAMRSFDEHKEFKVLLQEDADVSKVLSPEELEAAFDIDTQLRHRDQIFERVFG